MGLYLQGEALRTEDNVIPEPDAAEKSSTHSVASAYPLKASCSSSWKWDSWVCGPRLESPYFVRNVVPALKLDRFTYVWGHPCLKVGISKMGGFTYVWGHPCLKVGISKMGGLFYVFGQLNMRRGVFQVD